MCPGWSRALMSHTLTHTRNSEPCPNVPFGTVGQEPGTKYVPAGKPGSTGTNDGMNVPAGKPGSTDN
jgi:hypothetical protein